MRNEKGQFVKVSTYAVNVEYWLNTPHDSRKEGVVLIDVEAPCADSICKAIDQKINSIHPVLRVERWKLKGITKL